MTVNSINRPPHRYGIGRGRHLPLLLCALLGGSASPANATATLTVKGNLVAGTCDVTLVTPAVMDFGDFIPKDFTDNNGTAAIQNLQVKVDNCDQVTDASKTHVRVTASGLLNGETSIFSSDAGGDAGFMVQQGGTGSQMWTGSLSTFYDTGTAVKDGDLTHTGDIDPIQLQGTLLNYAVGFVAKKPTTPPTAGAVVTAQLTFTFVYQ